MARLGSGNLRRDRECQPKIETSDCQRHEESPPAEPPVHLPPRRRFLVSFFPAAPDHAVLTDVVHTAIRAAKSRARNHSEGSIARGGLRNSSPPGFIIRPKLRPPAAVARPSAR